jgi:hypothetical protein
LNPLIGFKLILMKAFAASDAVAAPELARAACNPRASYLKPKEMWAKVGSCIGL